MTAVDGANGEAFGQETGTKIVAPAMYMDFTWHCSSSTLIQNILKT